MRRIVSILLAVALLAVGGAAAVALAGNPHGTPPGQGECSHGATGKECKPDPQPDKGKDCEEHGKKGGVNEDHCGPPQTTPTDTTPTDTTPTETTPTETTPTETTPTTPAPPRCPPGMGPFRGKDGAPGNDECCPDQNNNQICDDEESAPPVTTTQPAPIAAATPPPPMETQVTPQAQPPAQPEATTTPKKKAKASSRIKPPSKPKPTPRPKLTGDAKVDKCRPAEGGTLNCKGIIVVPGNG